MAGENESTEGTVTKKKGKAVENETTETAKKLSKDELAEKAFKEVPHATVVYVNVKTQHYAVSAKREKGGKIEKEWAKLWEEVERELTPAEKARDAEWEKQKAGRVNAFNTVKNA